MTHKVHPKIYRVKNISDWLSRGFYKNPAEYLEEDFRIREFINKKLGKIGIEKIEIERSLGKTNVIISSARPGLIIGRGGEGVERLKKEVEQEISKLKTKRQKYLKNNSDKELSKIKKRAPVQELKIEIREVKNPWTSASLVGQWAAQQIEKRVAFRRVLKQGIAKVSANKEVKGVKIEVSGRLNGNEIARTEWLKSGRLPLQTLRSDIDYTGCEAYCTYGVIGIKVWIYKGEKFE